MTADLDPGVEVRHELAGEADAGHLAVRLARPATPRDPGLAVLYCHGFGSSQAGEKAAYFRGRFVDAGVAFCSFDFQAHGGSGGGYPELTLTRNVGDVGRVHRWLRGEGLGRVVLVGSSMGGAAALWYGALHPDGVVAGLHVAPALDMLARVLADAGDEAVEAWRRDGRRRFDHPLAGACELGWGFVEDLRRHPPARLASLHNVPTLVLQGVQDASVDWRDAVDFVAACPGDAVELHLLADGDHRLVDRKDHLFALMLGFLEARDLLPRAGASR